MSLVVALQPVASAEAFAALALRELLERVASTTAELASLRAALESAGRASLSIAQQQRLARACADLEEQGWLFGLCARELGSDVLFERRERDGLARALELVRALLERDGVELAVTGTPELDSGDERCSTICAVVARCVHAAHGAPPTPQWCFARCDEDLALRFTGTLGAPLRRALQEGAQRLEGARVRATPGGAELVLPRGCAVWT